MCVKGGSFHAGQADSCFKEIKCCRIRFKKWLNKNSTAGVIFALPFIIGFILFMIVPMAMSLYYSFCKFEILGAPRFIGFDNYIKMFTDDPEFYQSLSVTFFYALVSVPLRLVFALAVAMILLKGTKLTGFYRAAYYLPSIIGGSVAISILWKRMFAEDGTVNRLLTGDRHRQPLFLAGKHQYGYLGTDSAFRVAVWLVHAGIPLGLKADSHNAV